MNKIYKTYYESEIGILEISGNAEGIVSIIYVDEVPEVIEVPVCLEKCLRQIDEYFKGKRMEFTLDLLPQGTDFQLNIWGKLREIPFGKTVSYADIAQAAGNKKAVRAVGGANGRNRINIVIPCHRVIGKNGTLTGYGGGLWRKEWLLNHEKKFVEKL